MEARCLLRADASNGHRAADPATLVVGILRAVPAWPDKSAEGKTPKTAIKERCVQYRKLLNHSPVDQWLVSRPRNPRIAQCQSAWTDCVPNSPLLLRSSELP